MATEVTDGGFLAGETYLVPTGTDSVRLPDGTVAELLGHFTQEAEACLQLLGAAGAERLPEVTAAAHSLKGSSGMLGASEVSRLASRIEQESRAGQLSSEHFGQLRTAIDVFIPWLRSQVE